jgi:hypothetical protein
MKEPRRNLWPKVREILAVFDKRIQPVFMVDGHQRYCPQYVRRNWTKRVPVLKPPPTPVPRDSQGRREVLVGDRPEKGLAVLEAILRVVTKVRE